MTYPEPLLEEKSPISEMKEMNRSPKKRNLKTSGKSSFISEINAPSASQMNADAKSKDFYTTYPTTVTEDFYSSRCQNEESSIVLKFFKFTTIVFVSSAMVFTFSSLYPEFVMTAPLINQTTKSFLTSRGDLQTSMAFIGLISACLLVAFTSYKILKPAFQLFIALIFVVITPIFALYILMFVPSFVPPFAQKIVPQAHKIFETSRDSFMKSCAADETCEKVLGMVLKRLAE